MTPAPCLLLAPTHVHLAPVVGVLVTRVVLAALVLGVIAWAFPRLGAAWFRKLESGLGKLARRPTRAILLVGLLSFLLGPLIAWRSGILAPSVHDEFSYLLAADTFSHFRLTNPPHPMWMHFETFHVLQQPTYASRYPPAQGMMLAVGEILTGQPIVGEWLGAGLACAAVCWMLYAWVPPRWAQLGGLLTALHPLVLTWSENYWGGLVAMLGGVLVLGAVRRLAQRPQAVYALILGVGIAILANSRPYEGLVWTLCCLGSLLFWYRKQPVPLGIWMRQAGLPLLGVLLLAGIWMAYYDYRVTGHPFLMPYVLYQKLYTTVPSFVFQPLRPMPVYHHPLMQTFHTRWEYDAYGMQRTPAGWITTAPEKLLTVFVGFFRLFMPVTSGTEIADYHTYKAPLMGFALVLPLLALPLAVRRDWWMRAALGMLVVFSFGLLLETWMQTHYAAPAFGLAILLLIQGMRGLRAWRWRGRPVGRAIVRLLIVLYVLSFGITSVRLVHFTQNEWGKERVQIQNRLVRQGGQHLVIVQYRPGHDVHYDYVFNAADIDASPVVWARDMGPAKNQELLDYYKHRRVWLLRADANPPQLLPYLADKTPK